MISFFLIIHKSVNKEPEAILHDSPDGNIGGYYRIYSGNRIELAIESSRTVPPNSANQEFFNVDDATGCLIVSDSRIDYREELSGKLGLDSKIAEGHTGSMLILQAYLKWGEACLKHLYGDFSFVIWDPARNELISGRDHFGCRPLYYLDQPGFLALASQIPAFENIPGFRFKIREQYLLDTICSIVTNETLSAYEGIRRLKPAHFLKLSQGILSDQIKYWDLNPAKNFPDLTLNEASDGLRDRFIEAVRQRSTTHGQKGVELSGGLDSTGIASVLTMLSGSDEKINAFTHSVSSQDMAKQMAHKNEMEYSAAFVSNNNSITHFRINGEQAAGGYSAFTNALNKLRKPVNLHYAINSDPLYSAAANAGVAIMFSGLGGDEGISYNGSGYYNELIRHGQHSNLRDQIRSTASGQGKAFYGTLIRVYINFYIPWARRLCKKDWRKKAFRSNALPKHLARRYRMKRRFISKNFFPDRAAVREMQHFRLMYPNIPERIEATFLLAQQYGIEYRYPFLDVKLLEYFYALPSEYKFRDGTGRYLFRMAMKEILPENIRMRADKGGNTIPYVFDRVLKDEELFRKLIDECLSENQYHYTDYDKLHAMLDSFKKTGTNSQKEYGIREFQNAISVLIMQKWQREGELDIGIRC